MKRQNSIILVFIVVFLMAICAGCSITTRKHSSTPAQEATVKSEMLNEGTIDGSTYKHDYFGLTMQTRDKWLIHNKEMKEKVVKVGQNEMNGKDKNVNSTIEGFVCLLAMSKYPIGTSNNISFDSWAERVNKFTFKGDKEYLAKSFKAEVEKRPQLKYTVEKDIYTEKIDGIDFSVLEMKRQLPDTVVYQKYYATMMKDYYYGFVFTYAKQEDLKILNEIVSTMKFAK